MVSQIPMPAVKISILDHLITLFFVTQFLAEAVGIDTDVIVFIHTSSKCHQRHHSSLKIHVITDIGGSDIP
jgi:hypothetical protein